MRLNCIIQLFSCGFVSCNMSMFSYQAGWKAAKNQSSKLSFIVRLFNHLHFLTWPLMPVSNSLINQTWRFVNHPSGEFWTEYEWERCLLRTGPFHEALLSRSSFFLQISSFTSFLPESEDWLKQESGSLDSDKRHHLCRTHVLGEAVFAHVPHRKQCHFHRKHYPQTNWNKVLRGPAICRGDSYAAPTNPSVKTEELD